MEPGAQDVSATRGALKKKREAMLEALDQLGKLRDPKDVHKARTSARRLRAALRLLIADRPDREDRIKAAVKAVRKVADALSPTRDLDVAMDHARDLRRELETGESADLRGVNALLDSLREERRKVRRDARDALKRRAKQLRTRLEKLEASLEPADEVGADDGAAGDGATDNPESGEGAATQADAVSAEERTGDAAEGATDSAAKTADGGAEGAVLELRDRLLEQLTSIEAETPDREALHLARIAAKKLRYALELLHEGEERWASLLTRLKNLQDQLGSHRDWTALEERVTHMHARLVRHGRRPGIRAGLVALEPTLRRRVESQLEGLRPLAREVETALRSNLTGQRGTNVPAGPAGDGGAAGTAARSTADDAPSTSAQSGETAGSASSDAGSQPTAATPVKVAPFDATGSGVSEFKTRARPARGTARSARKAGDTPNGADEGAHDGGASSEGAATLQAGDVGVRTDGEERARADGAADGSGGTAPGEAEATPERPVRAGRQRTGVQTGDASVSGTASTPASIARSDASDG